MRFSKSDENRRRVISLGGTQAAVVGLGASYDMFDVGLPGTGKPAVTRVGSVDYASHIRDYSGFYGLGVRIVVGVIRRASVLRRDSQTPP